MVINSYVPETAIYFSRPWHLALQCGWQQWVCPFSFLGNGYTTLFCGCNRHFLLRVPVIRTSLRFKLPQMHFCLIFEGIKICVPCYPSKNSLDNWAWFSEYFGAVLSLPAWKEAPLCSVRLATRWVCIGLQRLSYNGLYERPISTWSLICI